MWTLFIIIQYSKPSYIGGATTLPQTLYIYDILF